MSLSIAFVTTGDIEDIATSKRAFGMVESLTRLGHRVSIILQESPGNRNRLADEAPSATAYWFRKGTVIKELLTKRRLLSELKPDVIYVGSFGFRNLVTPWRPIRATYLVEHSELPSAIQNISLKRRFANLLLEAVALRAFDGQICASRFLEQYVQRRVGEAHGHSVHYSPYAYNAQTLLPRNNYTERPAGARKTVLYMGTLARNYGIFHIMDAVSVLRKGSNKFECVVLGKGRHYEEAVGYAREKGLLDVVIFKGYVPEADLPEYFSAADVFVAPIFDTVQDKARCPSKLFMYLPFNRPVVTSQIGEAAELFGPDYDYYFAPGDVQGMAKSLNRALAAPRDWAAPWRAEEHEWTARTKAFCHWLCGLERIRGKR